MKYYNIVNLCQGYNYGKMAYGEMMKCWQDNSYGKKLFFNIFRIIHWKIQFSHDQNLYNSPIKGTHISMSHLILLKMFSNTSLLP